MRTIRKRISWGFVALSCVLIGSGVINIAEMGRLRKATENIIDAGMQTTVYATDMLNALQIPFEVHVYSAHRTPVEARDFALSARDNGFGVLICAAGMAAHLAGAIAANTTLPVIGIPCKGGMMDGLDALLSTVQMPTGIPVATVAINGGANAALLAAQILAVSDADLAKKLNDKRVNDAKVVIEKDAGIMQRL